MGGAATQSRGEPPLPRIRLAATLLAAATSAVPFLLFFLISTLVYDYRCNESCGISTGPYAVHGWSHFSDRPEWALQFWLLAVPTLIALGAFVVYLGKGRPGRALASLVLSVAGFVAYVYFPVLTGGAAPPRRFLNLNHSGPRLAALALVLFVLGAVLSIAAEFVSSRRGPDGQ